MNKQLKKAVNEYLKQLRLKYNRESAVSAVDEYFEQLKAEYKQKIIETGEPAELNDCLIFRDWFNRKTYVVEKSKVRIIKKGIKNNE